MKKTFTPKIGILVIVIILVVSVVLMLSKKDETATFNSSASGSPKSKSTLAANAEIGDYYTGPSIPPSSTSSATPIPKPPELKTYVYTGAKTISSTATKLELESNASPEAITAWYKKKIEDGKFNAKSLSQTNSNGNVLNSLSAAKPGEKIDIIIKKDQTTSKVLITVDRS